MSTLTVANSAAKLIAEGVKWVRDITSIVSRGKI